MEQSFDLSVKDGRKNLVLMAGLTWDEVTAALAKAAAKIKNAGNPIIAITLAETEETK